MPRWTAYLLWSTRKRRDVVVDHPDWSFAQIAKWISDEWKKVKIYTRIADVPGIDRGKLKTLKEKYKSLWNGYKITPVPVKGKSFLKVNFPGIFFLHRNPKAGA